MSEDNYIGARYLGEDPMHLLDGTVICKGEITDLLSIEAAENDNKFEPIYKENGVVNKIIKTITSPKKIKKGWR